MATKFRTIAIGDVHGCSKALRAVVEAIQPRHGDVIIALGDFVDRGPDSKGVLDFLIELSSRCRMIPILGNHDQMMRDALKGQPPFNWFEYGGLQVLDSYGPGRNLELVPDVHRIFLDSCLDYYEIETHIFAHANYYPDQAMGEQCVAMLRWVSLREFTPGPHESGKTVILGHCSQKSGEILDLGHLVCIDTYCHGGGWLTALDVATGETWQADRDGRMRN